MAKEKVIRETDKLVEDFLKNNKEHYNFVPDEVNSCKISTGSINFDFAIDGGIGPGCVLLTGPNEAGKTSFALSCVKNGLESLPNGKAVFVSSERPLSKELRERSGIKFAKTGEEFQKGTCLLFESNVYETVLDFCKALMQVAFQAKEQIIFVVDSVNALVRREDLQKSFDDAQKVAGGALMASTFLAAVGLALSKYGHYFFLTAQNRATIRGQYESIDQNKPKATSVGHAIPHYCNWMFSFRKPNQSQLIKEGDKTIGHIVTTLIEKSPNLKTGLVIDYPVGYNRPPGQSIWLEREVIDQLQMEKVFKQKGSWIHFEDGFVEFLKSKGLDLKSPTQGMPSVYEFFEKNKNAVSVTNEYFKQYLV